MFIVVFTKSCHLSLLLVTPYLTKANFNIIILSAPRAPMWPQFPSDFSIKMMYAFIVFPVRAARPSHLILRVCWLLYWITECASVLFVCQYRPSYYRWSITMAVPSGLHVILGCRSVYSRVRIHLEALLYV